MNKGKATEVAQSYFKTYPNATVAHVTSDEQVFFEKHHADNHGRSFKEGKDQQVHTVLKDETTEDQVANQTEDNNNNGEETKEPKAPKTKKTEATTPAQ